LAQVLTSLPAIGQSKHLQSSQNPAAFWSTARIAVFCGVYSQPQPIQALRAPHNRHAGFHFATLSVMIVVNSFAGASQNGNVDASLLPMRQPVPSALPYSKTRVRFG